MNIFRLSISIFFIRYIQYYYSYLLSCFFLYYCCVLNVCAGLTECFNCFIVLYVKSIYHIERQRYQSPSYILNSLWEDIVSLALINKTQGHPMIPLLKLEIKISSIFIDIDFCLSLPLFCTFFLSHPCFKYRFLDPGYHGKTKMSEKRMHLFSKKYGAHWV